jgi:hypothetical protein
MKLFKTTVLIISAILILSSMAVSAVVPGNMIWASDGDFTKLQVEEAISGDQTWMAPNLNINNVDPKENQVDIVAFPGANDRSVKFTKVMDGDIYFNIAFNSIEEIGEYIKNETIYIDADVYYEDLLCGGRFVLREPSGPYFFEPIAFMPNGIVTTETPGAGDFLDPANTFPELAKYEAKKWYNVKIVLNLKDDKYSVVFDDKLIVDAKSIREAMTVSPEDWPAEPEAHLIRYTLHGGEPSAYPTIGYITNLKIGITPDAPDTSMIYSPPAPEPEAPAPEVSESAPAPAPAAISAFADSAPKTGDGTAVLFAAAMLSMGTVFVFIKRGSGSFLKL